MDDSASAVSIQLLLRRILVVGLLVGVADYAIGFGLFVATLGAPILRVLQHPASGLLGADAYRGGLTTAALGIFLHFAIAIVWAGLFATVYRASRVLREATTHNLHAFGVATLAGVGVWLVMNNVVLALGRGRPYSTDSWLFWTILLLHIPFVGVPLVWGTRRYAPLVADAQLDRAARTGAPPNRRCSWR
jgi:hypothetical protein